MKEYDELLKEYMFEPYDMHSLSPKWGDKVKAEEYLQKYWLPKDEYENIWKPIQNQIFINQDSGLPKVIFPPKQYEIRIMEGGCLFIEEDFKQLQNCFLNIKNKGYFVIVENTLGGEFIELSFRMKYPIEITWEELASGDLISSVLLNMHHEEYFVFDDSGAWGKYAANDYYPPVDIIGFKPEYAALFKKQFKLYPEEWRKIKRCSPRKHWKQIEKWIPSEYKDPL